MKKSTKKTLLNLFFLIIILYFVSRLAVAGSKAIFKKKTGLNQDEIKLDLEKQKKFAKQIEEGSLTSTSAEVLFDENASLAYRNSEQYKRDMEKAGIS